MALTIRHAPELLEEYLPILVRTAISGAPKDQEILAVADAKGFQRAIRVHLLSLYDGIRGERETSLLYKALGEVGMAKERDRRDSRAAAAAAAATLVQSASKADAGQGRKGKVKQQEEAKEEAGGIPSARTLRRSHIPPPPPPPLPIPADKMARQIPLEVTVELVLASLLRISHSDLRRYAKEGSPGPSPIPSLGIRWGPRDPRKQDRRFADVPIRQNFIPDSMSTTTTPSSPTKDVHVQGSLDTVDTQMTLSLHDAMATGEGKDQVPGAASLLSALSTMKEEKEVREREEEEESSMPIGMLTSATFLRLLEGGTPSSPDWCALMGRLLSSLPEDNEEVRDYFLNWVLEDVGTRREGLVAWLYAEYGKEGYTYWQVRSLERLLPLCLKQDLGVNTTLEGKEEYGTNVLQCLFSSERRKKSAGGKEVKEEEEREEEEEDEMMDEGVAWGSECHAWVNLLVDLPEVEATHALIFVSKLLGLKSSSSSPGSEGEDEEMVEDQKMRSSSPTLGIHSIETLLASRSNQALRASLLSLLLPVVIQPEILSAPSFKDQKGKGGKGEEEEEEGVKKTLSREDSISLASLTVLIKTIKAWVNRDICHSLLQEVRDFTIRSLTEMTKSTLISQQENEGKGGVEAEEDSEMTQGQEEGASEEKGSETQGGDKMEDDPTEHMAPETRSMTLAEMRRRIWLFLAVAREDLTLLPTYVLSLLFFLLSMTCIDSQWLNSLYSPPPYPTPPFVQLFYSVCRGYGGGETVDAYGDPSLGPMPRPAP